MDEVERDFMALEFRWKGGYTQRYHGLRNLMVDYVGHHSYNVAQIVRFIAADLHPVRVFILLQAALDHDVAETVVGDMPAPTKRAIPGLRDTFAEYEAEVLSDHGINDVSKALTPEEATLLKAADSMDGMRFCIQEVMMGNRLAVKTYEAFESYVEPLVAGLPDMHRARRLFATLQTQWRLANV
jgi:5'-deoxynucleotidase YfbR-like HD superfamily hydrolase